MNSSEERVDDSFDGLKDKSRKPLEELDDILENLAQELEKLCYKLDHNLEHSLSCDFDETIHKMDEMADVVWNLGGITENVIWFDHRISIATSRH